MSAAVYGYLALSARALATAAASPVNFACGAPVCCALAPRIGIASVAATAAASHRKCVVLIRWVLLRAPLSSRVASYTRAAQPMEIRVPHETMGAVAMNT